jgi:hypothetical protein
MAMTVKRRKDIKRPSVFLRKIADIPGGVCISTQGLEGVDFLPEGTPITRPIDGICYVIKHGGVVGYGSAQNMLRIDGDIYNVQVGDVIDVYAVTDGGSTVDFVGMATVSEKDGDTLTFDEEIPGFDEEIPGLTCHGYWIVVDTQNPDKNKVFALTGTGVAVKPDDNVITDAWVQAVTRIPNLPPQFFDDLKGIINYV